MTKPVETITISCLIPIYKNGEAASSIEVVNFNFFDGNECGYNVISQKGIYSVGDKAIYIQPDYCLPDTPMFSEFTAPKGDANKSRLGRNNRVRALKFNFNFENSSNLNESKYNSDNISVFLNLENKNDPSIYTNIFEIKTNYKLNFNKIIHNIHNQSNSYNDFKYLIYFN